MRLLAKLSHHKFPPNVPCILGGICNPVALLCLPWLQVAPHSLQTVPAVEPSPSGRGACCSLFDRLLVQPSAAVQTDCIRIMPPYTCDGLRPVDVRARTCLPGCTNPPWVTQGTKTTCYSLPLTGEELLTFDGSEEDCRPLAVHVR